MSEQGAGRRIAPLSAGLSPAHAAFAHELRRHLERSGITLRNLSARAHLSPSTVSRYFSGARLPTPRGLRQLCEVMGLNDEDCQRLDRLLTQAMEEEPGLAGEVHLLAARLAEAQEQVQRLRAQESFLHNVLAQYEGATGRHDREFTDRGWLPLPSAETPGSQPSLATVLATLKQDAGLPLRQIAELLAATGVTASKSSVDRAIHDPAASPRLSFHIAEVLIEQLPQARRGAARDELFRALPAVGPDQADMAVDQVSSEPDPASALAFSPDNAVLATVDSGTVRLWDPRTRKRLASVYASDENVVQAVAFSPDGAVLATGDAGGTVRVWDSTTGELKASFSGHQNAVQALVVSPDGAVLATGDAGGTVRVWDSTTGELKGSLSGHQNAVRGAAFSPDGTLLATRDISGNVQMWDLTNRAPVRTAAFAPDGTLLNLGDTSDRPATTPASGPPDLPSAAAEASQPAPPTRTFSGTTHRASRKGGGWRSGRRPAATVGWEGNAAVQAVSASSGVNVSQARSTSRSTAESDVRAALESLRHAAEMIDSEEDRSTTVRAAARIEAALYDPDQNRNAIAGTADTIAVLGRIHAVLAGPALAVQQAVQQLL
ncbi:helix-turn-helix domain-containing protein (plasmid) [Streptomyces canus]|uniref:helix-turn-helix domain-containing protein n=1 Tax=Streptomyces canus TaxID=58343 RepID=UPI002F913BF1|nr:helix-turn-helix domain-containing protein [Streptomyces canus]